MGVQWVILAIVTIVGLVTTYLNTAIDRVFVILLLILWAKVPIQDAIVINAIVMFLSALLFFHGSRERILSIPKSVVWSVLLLSFIGGGVGRWIGLQLSDQVLWIILGIYAILVGVRLWLLTPKLADEGKYHPAVNWVLSPFSLLTGVLSAGGKPLMIPLLAKLFKLSLGQSYLLASLGTMGAISGFLTGQVLFDSILRANIINWSIILFVGITLISFMVEPLWNKRGQQWTANVVGPLLILVGLKLLA